MDTSNIQMVGVQGGDIVVMAPKTRMTKDEALMHAAWIVALADEGGNFETILDAVTML